MGTLRWGSKDRRCCGGGGGGGALKGSVGGCYLGYAGIMGLSSVSVNHLFFVSIAGYFI